MVGSGVAAAARGSALAYDFAADVAFAEAVERALLVSGYAAEAPVGMQEQVEELEGSLARAFRAGGNTSMLLVGFRGCGKSLALRTALGRIVDPVQVVYLKGSVLGDDAAALQDIARQLQPAEFHANIVLRSFQENLKFLVDALRHGALGGQPILFVLDDFEFFARGKQTLLYNLLDLTQSSDAAIVVLGMSSNLTVIEELEKRVKSRFSQRQIFFPRPSHETATRMLEVALSLRARLELDEEGAGAAGAAAAFRSPPAAAPTPVSSRVRTPATVIEDRSGRGMRKPQREAFLRAWDAAVRRALADPKVVGAIRMSVCLGRSHEFFRAITDAARPMLGDLIGLPGARAGACDARGGGGAAPAAGLVPFERILHDAILAQAPEPYIQSILDSSGLEMVFLGCMARLENRGIQPFGFGLVWGEYQQYLRLNPTSTERFPRRVALQAFAALAARGLIISGDEDRRARTGVENLLVRLVVEPNVIVELFGIGGIPCSTALHRWVTKWNQGV